MKETIVIGGVTKTNQLSILVRARFHQPENQTIEDLIRYGIYLVERTFEKVRERGLSHKVVVVYDRTGMTSANRDNGLIKFTMKFVQILQDYYAERLSHMFIIGANWVFRAAYMVIKPFLSQKTKDKLTIITDLE
jgi:hypothetical protein